LAFELAASFFSRFSPKVQNTEYFREFSIVFSVQGLIRIDYLVGNTGPIFEALHFGVPTRRKLFLGGFHQKTQNIEYVCEFSIVFYVLGLIGIVCLVGNMGHICEALHFGVPTRRKLFLGGFHHKTQKHRIFP
jgi:hypothetical protein